MFSFLFTFFVGKISNNNDFFTDVCTDCKSYISFLSFLLKSATNSIARGHNKNNKTAKWWITTICLHFFVFSNCFHRYLFNFLAVVALFVWQLTSFTLAFTYIHTFMLTSYHFFRCFPFYGAKKHYFVYDSTHTQTDSPYALLLRARLQWKWTNLHTLFYALHCIESVCCYELSWAEFQCSAVAAENICMLKQQMCCGFYVDHQC